MFIRIIESIESFNRIIENSDLDHDIKRFNKIHSFFKNFFSSNENDRIYFIITLFNTSEKFKNVLNFIKTLIFVRKINF